MLISYDDVCVPLTVVITCMIATGATLKLHQYKGKTVGNGSRLSIFWQGHASKACVSNVQVAKALGNQLLVKQSIRRNKLIYGCIRGGDIKERDYKFTKVVRGLESLSQSGRLSTLNLCLLETPKTKRGFQIRSNRFSYRFSGAFQRAAELEDIKITC